MADKQTTLTAERIRSAGLDDWRQIRGPDKGEVSHRRLVNAIGEAAQAADHHPDVTLTFAAAIVSLSSHDANGITDRDLDLARRISSCSAELGVVGDVSGLTEVELGLDTARGKDLAPFYAALLGARIVRGEPVDPSGQVPTIRWQETGALDKSSPRPGQHIPQRWHLDVWVAHDDARRQLQAVLDTGGRLVSDASAPAYWVVEDADGNRSCICTPAGR